MGEGAGEAFIKLCDTLKFLRSEQGCPWDREQTPSSLIKHLVEESYELYDAITNADDANIREEVGDIYLVIGMIATIFEERKTFTVSDAILETNAKLIRRHPHVFAGDSAADAEEGLKKWQTAKRQEKESDDGLLARVGRGLPPLEKSVKIQSKAAKVGFDWEETHEVLEKVIEEFNELKIEIDAANLTKIREEFGDFLFSAVALARSLEIDPVEAMHAANEKFLRRFSFVEKTLEKQGLNLSKESKDAMESAWKKAKLAGL